MISSPITGVIVTYNSELVVCDAIDSIVRHPLIHHVIVVDNASEDGTIEKIKKQFPDIQLVENTENKGFGAANNIALKQVETDFVLLLNPDAIMNEEALNEMFQVIISKDKAAIVGPQLMLPNGDEQQSHKANLFDRENGIKPLEVSNGDPISVEYIPAACWLCRTSVLNQLGGFDERIFLYYEDDAFCLKFKASGYEMWHVPEAKVTHALGSGSKRDAKTDALKQMYQTHSRLYLESVYQGETAGNRLATKFERAYKQKIFWYKKQFWKENETKVQKYEARLRGVKLWQQQKTHQT